jgi:hypothetical protein
LTVILVPIARETIPAEWWRIGPMLASAVGHDKNASLDDVRQWLETGHSEAAWVGVYPNVAGLIVTTIGPDDGVEACWLNYVAGTIGGGPKAFILSARAVVDLIAGMAREAGCTELRGGGRNWSRVFPDWERFDPDFPNRMRKRLL